MEEETITVLVPSHGNGYEPGKTLEILESGEIEIKNPARNRVKEGTRRE
jgi:hypothetical protein